MTRNIELDSQTSIFDCSYLVHVRKFYLHAAGNRVQTEVNVSYITSTLAITVLDVYFRLVTNKAWHD